LTDFSGYLQDDASEEQFDLHPDVGLRDFRLLFKGKFKTERPLSWTLGYMWDGSLEEWRFRQTGVMVGVPELSGKFFLGRTKEGYSMIKVMVGYHGWTIERSYMNDAFVPILADGIKYMGWFPRSRIFVNLGAFADWLSENEGFSTYDNQFVWRAGWHPILSEENHKVLQIALMGREAKPDEDKFRAKSRPEAYLAPFYLDTGTFPSDRARTLGIESFYRAGPWLFATEVDWQTMTDIGSGDVLFHGFLVAAAWNITGETRPYNAAGSYFEAVSPNRTVFEGGPGAWELVLNYSYSDFDSGRLHGGKLWRITPMVNWHLSDNVRLEFVYGYGKLDRFGVEGATQFFQSRIQFSL